MGTNATAIPEPEARPPINHVGRLAGVLFNPKATFEDIVRRPSWIAPVVLLSILSLGIVAIFSQRVGWEQFMRKQFDQSPRTAQMSPEEREQALTRAVPFARTIGYVAGTVGTLIVVVIVAGVFLGVFNLAAGAELRYSASLAIVSHAFMPGALKAVLAVVVLYLKDPSTIDVENLVASNAGAFLSGETPKWQVTLASAFDLFAFWNIALMAMGYAAANPKKISFGKALGFIIAFYVLYQVARVGWVAAFS